MIALAQTWTQLRQLALCLWPTAIRQVPPREVLRDWPFYLERLNRVVERTDLEHRPDDILTCIQLGEMQMWRCADAIGVTQLQTYPRYRQLLIYAVAGENVRDWLHAAGQQLEAFALSQNCTRIAFHGRPGWQKFAGALGYQTQLVVMRKRLEDGRRQPTATDDKNRTVVRAAALSD